MEKKKHSKFPVLFYAIFSSFPKHFIDDILTKNYNNLIIFNDKLLEKMINQEEIKIKLDTWNLII